MANWLVKTEPDTYGYDDLDRLGKDRWNGVRNWTALRHISNMAPGDLIFIYHTGKEKAIVGLGEVVSQPYPDPEAEDRRYLVFDLIPKRRFDRAVPLSQIKRMSEFNGWELVRQPRLSVMPVSDEYRKLINNLAEEFKFARR